MHYNVLLSPEPRGVACRRLLLQFHLPLQHIPKIHVLDSLDMYLDEGLYDIAINIQKEDNDVY